MSADRPRRPGSGPKKRAAGPVRGGVDPRSRPEGGDKRGRPPRTLPASTGSGKPRGPRRSDRVKPAGAAKPAAPARPVATMTAPVGPMRVQRALARAGIASRRHAEELIAAGRVTVNGAVAQTGQVVDPARDAIAVDGKQVEAPSKNAEWIVLNKPSGVLTTRTDPEGRPTIFGLVPDLPGLTYVGRLDYLTEGVLLLTTDGAAANALTHPSNEVERTYVAVVRGEAGKAAREAMRGVELEDGEVKAIDADAAPIGKGRWEFRVVLTEGRNREVRRLCEALGLTVERLVRTRFGPVSLGGLEPGQSRPLSVSEGRAIKELARRRRPTRTTE